jgi:hypothetical protein
VDRERRNERGGLREEDRDRRTETVGLRKED